jgi:ABC-type lipoprotein export system ATPase subunit/copper chaperone CopZ
MSEPLIRVTGLWKVFGEGETRVEAVRDLDLELARGEIVLVMGPSGSGKTTLLSMLGGLLRPTRGEIWVDGVDIATLSEHELPRFRAHRFGFIFQDFNLLTALSAEENVEVALNLAGSRGTDADRRARQLLDDLGLGARLDFAADQLSGGEKQRVAVARAIANRPQLILADEPTANLDSQRGQETMRLLRRLANDEGATVLIVSHDERLREVADRVLWLEDGRFKEMAALVRDPVCDMLLDPRTGAGADRAERVSDLLLLARMPRAVRAGARERGRPRSRRLKYPGRVSWWGASERGGANGHEDLRRSRDALRSLQGGCQTRARGRRWRRTCPGRSRDEARHGARRNTRRRRIDRSDRRSRLRRRKSRRLMNQAAAPERVRLEIGGMTCASCAARIERRLNKLEGVEATVNYATEEAAVSFDPARLDVDALVAVVEATGYTAAPPRTVPDAEQAGESEARMLRLRLVVAMLLSIGPVLFVVVPPARFAGWEWLALALSAPVVLWAGWPFHRAAALNARHLTATMDTLISIGTLAALLWSTVVLVAGLDTGTYFEVGAVTTTLILLGRFFEARARRRSGEAIRKLLALGAKEAHVLRDGRELAVPIEELRVGDRFVVRPGEKVATDGVVVDGASAVDQSMLTGESVPV